MFHGKIIGLDIITSVVSGWSWIIPFAPILLDLKFYFSESWDE